MELEDIKMSGQNVFEQYRHMPGEDTSVPFVVTRNGKTEKACYYFYSYEDRIEVTQVCFVKEDGSTDLIKFNPRLIVSIRANNILQARIAAIKSIKDIVKNGEL